MLATCRTCRCYAPRRAPAGRYCSSADPRRRWTSCSALRNIFSSKTIRTWCCANAVSADSIGTPRNVADLGGALRLKELTHLPVILDPSHASGQRTLIEPLTLAAAASGLDGAIIGNAPIARARALRCGAGNRSHGVCANRGARVRRPRRSARKCARKRLARVDDCSYRCERLAFAGMDRSKAGAVAYLDAEGDDSDPAAQRVICKDVEARIRLRDDGYLLLEPIGTSQGGCFVRRAYGLVRVKRIVAHGAVIGKSRVPLLAVTSLSGVHAATVRPTSSRTPRRRESVLFEPQLELALRCDLRS